MECRFSKSRESPSRLVVDLVSSSEQLLCSTSHGFIVRSPECHVGYISKDLQENCIKLNVRPSGYLKGLQYEPETHNNYTRSAFCVFCFLFFAHNHIATMSIASAKTQIRKDIAKTKTSNQTQSTQSQQELRPSVGKVNNNRLTRFH